MVNLLAFALARYPRDKKKYRVFRWLGLRMESGPEQVARKP
jgi:hypothetical protein